MGRGGHARRGSTLGWCLRRERERERGWCLRRERERERVVFKKTREREL